MADMPTDFWSGYIVGITAISFVVLAWLVVNVYFSGGQDSETAEQVWDDDLREGTNPAPLWWFWFILALMAFSVIYLMLYPGLGAFAGTLRWSQGGEIESAMADHAAEFGPERARLVELSLAELRAEPAALRTGERVFRVHCSACHGEDARGQALMFPDLTDAEWQWGGSEAQIRQSIAMGRTAVMPPWLAALQDAGVAELTEYVMALAEGRASDPALAPAKTRYDQFCAACHGAEGGGNPLLGAPALDDDVSLYGSSYAAVYESIAAGRTGVMPAYGDRLDATQIKLLTAWVAPAE